MDSFGLGLIITVVGIVVTLITLVIIMYIIRLLSRIFPYKEAPEKKG
jgi:Na+-transporting methylmalonyl-CoA/oxaloacetate decarboxylase gamma subunit